MPMLTCPSCKKSDRVPDKFIGARLKCKACGTSILVTAQGAEAAAATTPAAAAAKAVAARAPSGIEVEGLDSTAWSTVSEPPVTTAAEPVDPNHEVHELEQSSLRDSTSDAGHAEGSKEYKILTQKDKWFNGKFDLARLEEALNAYAQHGWVVKSMATPHIAGFSGGPREELVILLER